MTQRRWSHTATQLNTSGNTTTSGRVLVAGGFTNGASVATSQLYTVTGTGAGTWATVGSAMGVARHLHTATLLPNGNVLVAGGQTTTTTPIGSAAIYSPGTSGSGSGTWTAVGTNMSARRFHTATLLNSSSNSNFSDRVLIVGGNSGGTTSVLTYQLFNTSALTWSTAVNLPAAREGHTATKLANGNVLITGGKAGTSAPLTSTFVFTIPTSGSTATFPSAGTLSPGRWGHTATLLQSGVLPTGQSVVVVGGSSANGSASIAGANLWNGTTTWTSTTSLANPLHAHTATLLTGGRVLVAGGINSTATPPTVNTAQVYDPSTGIACTTGTQCASGSCVNNVCCNTACTDQCFVCNAATAGICSPKTGNPTCTDGSACTTGETCQANGTCGGGTAVTCTTNNPCMTAGTCNPASGCPAPTNKPNDTPCTDADACITGKICTVGACGGGTPVTCTTSNPCKTAGTCNPASGCPMPTNKLNGTACSALGGAFAGATGGRQLDEHAQALGVGEGGEGRGQPVDLVIV